MSTRKIILLSVIGILAAVYAGQLIYSGRSQIRELTLTAVPDTVVINNAYGTITFAEKDGKWTVSQGGAAVPSATAYPADFAAANAVLRMTSDLSVLGTVSVSGNTERYGLTDGEFVSAELLKDGEVLRSLKIGKTSVTAQQTYMQLDGKKDVLLVSGDAAAALNKSVNDFRSREVYSIAAEDIGKVRVTLAAAQGRDAQSYVLEKSGEPPQWQFGDSVSVSAVMPVLDAEKTASWTNSIASLNALSWASDNTVLPAAEKAEGSVTLTAAGADGSARRVTVTIFSKDDNGNYLCSSDAVPYAFYLSSYAAEKYLKPAAALSAAE